MIGITDPDPVIVVPAPIIDCGNNCGNLPGLDWLWWILGTLGAVGLLCLIVAVVFYFLFDY